jgi:inositol phosphorylceramide mannosyltransferase catalytic subunit
VIPRRFHRYWTGTPMPAHLEAYGRTWEDHHPGWESRLWTDVDLPPLHNQRLFDQAVELVPADAVGQFRADIVRYELLIEHGGIWVDCDLECRRPFDEVIRGVDCFAGWERQSQWVGNTILGSVPGHPFMRALVDGLEANVRRRAGSRPAKLSGPQYVTRVYRRHAKSVTVFPQHRLYPYAYDELDRQGEPFPDAWCVHHWDHQRSLRGAPA